MKPLNYYWAVDLSRGFALFIVSSTDEIAQEIATNVYGSDINIDRVPDTRLDGHKPFVARFKQYNIKQGYYTSLSQKPKEYKRRVDIIDSILKTL